MTATDSAGLVERRALFYPWVHFPSDDWVKKTLLVFPGLFRMVADSQLPYDSGLVNKLRSRALIRHADLRTLNAQEAQQTLMSLIREDLDLDADGFKRRFGMAAAKRSGQPSFQMNLDKATLQMSQFLRENDLTWHPDLPDNNAYSELHPSLGQAVMGTIAMACAEDAGLHILGVDSPRGKDVSVELNNTLSAHDQTGPYKRFVRQEISSKRARADADQLFHVMVNLNCDVSKLDADSLAKLQDEREATRLLKQRIQCLASAMPYMVNPIEREEAFRDKANEIVHLWQADRANLSKYCREVFALDAFGGGVVKFLDVMTEKLLPAGITGGGASFANVQAGIAIGLLTHLGSSYAKVRKPENDSPWRYMTLAEGAGANFSVSTASSFDGNKDLKSRR